MPRPAWAPVHTALPPAEPSMGWGGAGQEGDVKGKLRVYTFQYHLNGVPTISVRQRQTDRLTPAHSGGVLILGLLSDAHPISSTQFHQSGSLGHRPFEFDYFVF